MYSSKLMIKKYINDAVKVMSRGSLDPMVNFYPLRKATKSNRSSETQYYIPIFVYLNSSRPVHLRNLYKKN